MVQLLSIDNVDKRTSGEHCWLFGGVQSSNQKLVKLYNVYEVLSGEKSICSGQKERNQITLQQQKSGVKIIRLCVCVCEDRLCGLVVRVPGY
jgi:hypothetical protein